MSPLVSVVIPVYNIEKYISKCLESVCGQSYTNLEIIIVDDGSTDESGKICDEFEKKDSRIKVFHKKNGGLSAARNFGISKSHGDFVVLVDGDDWVQKKYVAEMIKVVDDKTDVVICGYNGVVPQARTMSGDEAATKLLVGQENLEIVAWNKLYRTKLFDEVKYPEGEKHEDALTTYKLFALSREVKYIPESLYVYVKREGSIMDTVKIIERLKARERAAKEAVQYFMDDGKMKQAAEVAELTAKFAFMDAAVRGEIDKKYYLENVGWIKRHELLFKKNKLVTKKLKFYNFLLKIKLYKIFRTIV